ncbi:MAG: radical SAM protein [Candidatus Pacearchaeota archaeon]|jgi:radical SAM superfamily enzyme YgiQ (UPF0313 family)
MKFELIIPPNPYLGDDKRNPPLGLLYIASKVERDGTKVRVSDLRGKDLGELENIIGNADVYGITASTPDYLTAKEIAFKIKSKNYKSKIIIGGIHATSVPNEIDKIFDKVVIGEGEQIISKILKDINKGDKTRFYQDSPIENLDEIPFPAYHLIPFESAFSKNAFEVGGEPAAAVITSRGCPYSCSFCASRKMWPGKVRFRSTSNVINEVNWLKKDYGIKNFRFQDDTMTFDYKKIKSLCEELAPLEIKWRAATRVDKISLEVLKSMKNSGCEEIAFGVESLCQDALDKVGKRVEVSDFYKAMNISKEAGLKTRLYFIIGLPGEAPGFADRLIKFTQETNPDGIDVSTLVPYPGSDIYHHPEKYGIVIKPENFSKYNMTLGMKEGEIDRPFTFIHDILSENELKYERKIALEYVKSRKMVLNF